MRGAAMSVWVFINLLFFGMCGYLYLIWSQYWMYLEKQRLFSREGDDATSANNFFESLNTGKLVQSSYGQWNRTAHDPRGKSRRSAVGAQWRGGRRGARGPEPGGEAPGAARSPGVPRFPNAHSPVLRLDTDDYSCDDLAAADCPARTAAFKEALLKEFHRVLMADSNVFRSGLESQNTYNVPAARAGGGGSGRELRCELARVPLRLVSPEDEPFRSEGFRIPPPPPPRGYRSCAVVTSAGALLGSGLGEFIDSHEMVLRFNNAPTENYTEDVGSKTHFRVLNSQVVTKPEYGFLSSPLYRNVSLLLWDPANYSASLHQWYRHPDYPLFPVYKALLERRRSDGVGHGPDGANGPDGGWAGLLHPEVLWRLWRVLQDSSPYRLRRNPPSSGFIGLWYALHRCERVRMFEYVPSARATARCHYHAPRADAACTLGAWHPLAQEKALAERLRTNADVQVFQRGYIEVPGFRTLRCPQA